MVDACAPGDESTASFSATVAMVRLEAGGAIVMTDRIKGDAPTSRTGDVSERLISWYAADPTRNPLRTYFLSM
jgi:hypothetical protein